MIVKYWQRTSFWAKVKDTLGLFGPGTEAVLIIKEVNPNFQLTLAVLGILGYAIAIWMEDKDNNGIVDILENKQID